MKRVVRRVVWEISRQDLAGVQSHIHGLGLDDPLELRADSQGMHGRAKATRAAGTNLKTVQQGQGRKSNVVCWVSIDGKDRYCIRYISVFFYIDFTLNARHRYGADA